MNIFELLEQGFSFITSYFGEGNKRLRQLRRMHNKVLRVFRQFAGYTLDNQERLSNAELSRIFLPDSQSPAEIYLKLQSLHKDEMYSILLVWCWATDHGKNFRFMSQPQIG